MSSPRASSPHRLPFQGQFGFQSDRLQIRVVPYSPPRPNGPTPTSPKLAPYTNVSSRITPANLKIEGQHGSAADPGSLNAPSKAKQPSIGPKRHVTPEGTKPQAANRKPSISSSPSLSSSSSPWRRPKRLINLHPDGTFSLVQQQSDSLSSRTDSTFSPGISSTTPSGSHGRMSSTTATTLIDDCSCPPLTPVAEQKHEFPVPSPPEFSPANKSVGSESPRDAEYLKNYRLSASARKIPTEALGYGSDISGPSQLIQSQIPQPFAFAADNAPIDEYPVIPLGNKRSFQSSISGSMFSERTNYRIYARSSPRSSSANDFAGLDLGSPRPSSSGSDHAMCHDNESVAQSDHYSVPRSDQSEANYVLHGRSRSSSFLTSSRSQLRTEYSQESLVVAPLRPKKHVGSERPYHAKSRSCDSSITAYSSKTTSSRSKTESLRSLSFVPCEASHALDSSFGFLSNNGDNGDDQQACSPSGPNASCKSTPRKKHWSSTLSTVMSEAENGSEPPSRSLSPLLNGSHDNGPHTNYSAQNGTFSSSLAGLDEASSVSRSRTTSLDRPQATHSKETRLDQRLIRDHDEDGDGLAELEDMHRRLSRARHHNAASNGTTDRNIYSSRSSRSSRANSISRNAIPQWARLYYGSGERRFLTYKASRESLTSNFSDGQPIGSLISRSPVDVNAAEITNPRKQPQEYHAPDSDAISEIPLPSSFRLVAHSIKRRTSSIWSPHLRRDRRAGQNGIWTPPSLVAYHDCPYFWNRNIQIGLFVIGFLFPFGWMIGGILPLPTKHVLDMVEHGHSTSHLDLGSEYRHQLQETHAVALQDRTKWWRGVNRRMSVLGIFLVGAYVILAVIGVHQQWTAN